VASDDEDDDDYVETVRDRRLRQETPQLGPPITIDQRMADLPGVHLAFVNSFVEEANKEMEKIRNAKNLKKPIFTEANLREMAIGWTTTLKRMEQIPNINVESVKTWGKKFIPMIERYETNYETAIAQDGNEDRDMDQNHRNVINLCSDDEDDDDDEYGMNASDEDAILEAERGSKYFVQQQSSRASSFKQQGQSNRAWADAGSGAASRSRTAPKKAARGGNRYSNRGAKGRRKVSGGRRSNSSGSGQSHAGVVKRQTSATAKKPTGATGPSDFFSQFGFREPGRGGGSGAGGGGIRPMPT
jgi:bloom syndrome protein